MVRPRDVLSIAKSGTLEVTLANLAARFSAGAGKDHEKFGPVGPFQWRWLQ